MRPLTLQYPNTLTMKKILVLFTLFGIYFSSQCQINFARTYGTAADEYGQSLAKTSDGGFIIGTPYTGNKWGIIKTDEHGDTIWTRTYDFLGVNFSNLFIRKLHGIIETSDGNYVMIGCTETNRSFVMKVNTIGDTLWVKDSIGGTYRKIAEDSNGDLIIVGGIESVNAVNFCCYPLIHKRDSQGILIQNINIFSPSFLGSRLQEIYIDSNGDYLLGGDTPNPYIPNPRLIKLSPNGTIIWANIFTGFEMSNVQSILQTPDNGYLFVGNYPQLENDSTVLFKTNFLGELEFIKKYKVNSNWIALNIKPTADGYYISGDELYDEWVGGPTKIHLMKIDLNYNLLWQSEYALGNNNIFAQMESTVDGGCAIVGSTDGLGNGGFDVFFIKTDANGQALETENLSFSNFINIYPNPVRDNAFINSSAHLNNATLLVFDNTGHLVKEINHIYGKSINFSRGNLCAGCYFAKIYESNKCFSTVKILVSDK